MANIKQGLDYFPLDWDFFHDEKIQFITAKFGSKGEIITIKLLTRIYRNGYYLKFDNDSLILFSNQIPECDYVYIKNVVDELLKRDFLSKEKYDAYQILTSNGIQKRYFEITKRRTSIIVEKDYLLNGTFSNQNVTFSNQNVTKQPQSVSESKGNEKKRNEKKVEEEPHALRIFLNDYSNILKMKEQLTNKNCETILKKFDKKLVKDVIEAMENKKDLSKNYISVNRTIQSWCKMRIDNGYHPQSNGINETAVIKKLKECLMDLEAGRIFKNHNEVLNSFHGDARKIVLEKLKNMGYK